MKNFVKILEKNGFDITKENNGYILQQYTPAGEDWTLYILDFDDLKNYAEDFDPEEEFTMWIEARRNGVEGIPAPSELWQDQLWKQKLLSKIAKRL